MTVDPTRSAADSAGATFRLPDANHRLRSVRLQQQVGVPARSLGFGYTERGWTLRLRRPPVDRMEYLFEVQHVNGRRETITDPTNPLRAPGAFGDKSVLEFPGYTPPAWLDAPDAPVAGEPIAVECPALDDSITGELWTLGELAAEEPALLLVVHDGPEYANLGGLTHYLAAAVAAATLAPLRVALLAPGDRNRWYAADPSYAQALCEQVLPALPAPALATVGLGVSLGGLAMLHAHRLHPGTFAGLALQSGSFFTPVFDPQERRFARFEPLTRFVADVEQAVADADPVPVLLTCGTAEENLGNNRAMTATLARLGYDAVLHEVRDAHNYVAWRDALDPALVDLLRTVAARAS